MGGQLSQRTGILGLRLWEIVALGVGALTALVLFLLSLRLHALARSKSKKQQQLVTSIPEVSKVIKEVQVQYDSTHGNSSHKVLEQQAPLYYKLPSSVGSSARHHSLSAVDILDDVKEVVTFEYAADTQAKPKFHSVRRPKLAAAVEVKLAEEQLQVHVIDIDCRNDANCSPERNPPATPHDPAQINAIQVTAYAAEVGTGAGGASSRSGSRRVDEQQQWSGWGAWYSLEELEKATRQWAESNIVGKGGYGIVYQGLLPDASVVAVKHLLNVSREQAEKEFRVEVEAIGRVRHKNLVGLLGYCAEGPHRLAYLHEDLEPKVVHRDVKASNILLDKSWNAKVSDFGLAKLLGAGMSHVTTRVMGTFGFGVLMMEVITGRDPVDYSRPAREMNLVEWTKRMVGSKRWEEVVDPQLSTLQEEEPSSRAVKRALLVALRCVDPDALHRPRMGHVVYMLEADDLSAFHHVHSLTFTFS
ncbi:hypothetical protein L7F22_009070 [Adiantum nelumboides]|nr:hypothetical protein [Adiantum nelumboides]